MPEAPAPTVGRILRRSLPLLARAALPLRPSPSYERDRPGREAAWARAVSPADADGLRRRAERLGLPPGRLDALLAAEPAADPVGPWADVFHEATALAPCAVSPGASPPLADALGPFLGVARRRLRAGVPGRAYRQFLPEAHRDTLRALGGTLWDAAAEALRAEFAAFRSTRAGTEADLRARFVGAMRGDRWLVFFDAYPVLARLLSQAVVHWVEATAELLARLDADRAALADALGVGRGPVAAVGAGLSDPHRGGRTVAVLTVDDGTRVVYKPRDLTLEAVFGAVARRASGRDGGPTLRAPGLLLCGGYGWMEYVEARPPETAAEAARYHARLGALLALAHGLCATDLHAENVIGCGAHPVLIDLEALASPTLAVAPEIAFNRAAWERLRASVLQTGLLPAPQGGRPDDPDVSAVRPEDLLAGGREDLDAARAAVLDGFAAGYRFLMAERDALTAPDGPLAPLRTTPVRFLLRHTRSYGRLLHKLRHPRYLRDGLDRSLTLDALARPLLTAPPDAVSWGALADETRALDALDVPLFTADPAHRALVGEGGAIAEGCFDESGDARVRARLDGLSEADLAYQRDLIRHALTPPATPAVGPAGSPLLEAAGRVYRELAQTAVRGDGQATWLVPDPLDPDAPTLLRPLGPDLYKGACGVALFLAAYARVTADADAGHLAREALRPVADVLRDGPARGALADAIGIGGGSGLGSLVYGFVAASRLLGDAALLAPARAAAAEITDARIAADTGLDVVAGAAGAAHGLLALAEATGDARFVARARACGVRLLATRQPGPTGHRAWRTLDDALAGGAAHGASGIAHALRRLARATGEAAWAEAAWEALAFEASLYLPGQANWRSVAAMSPEASVPCAWCHGAAGVVLARLDGLAPPDVRRAVSEAPELEAGLQTVVAHATDGADSLCCGRLGRVEALRTAGTQLGRPDLLAEANRAARAVAERVLDGSTTLASFSGHRAVGLFQGTAGVGYGLLRAARPDLVPSVVSWG